MKKMIMSVVLGCFAAGAVTAAPFKFVADCTVNGKETKGVHVHDITYDTMDFCNQGKDLMATSKATRFTRICNEKAKVKDAKQAKTSFKLRCVQNS